MKPQLTHFSSIADQSRQGVSGARSAGRFFGMFPRATVLVAALFAASGAQAQELYTFTVGVLGGIGGSPDAPHTGFDRQSLQLNLQFQTDTRTQVGLRFGQIDLADRGERISGLFEPTLQYVTVGGEYRSRQTYYDSGIFIALGGYRLDGSGGSTQNSLGVSAGATGEFAFNRRFGVVAEIAGHYADLDEVQYFGTAQIGLVFHF